MNRFIPLLLFIVLFGANLKAQISVEALLDSTTMLIGDQTDLHLRVTAPPNVAVQFPTVTAQELGDLEIVKIHPPDTLQASANQLTIQQNVTVAAFDSGFYRIPELAFKYGNRSLYSKPLELTVLTLEIDSTFIAPIKTIRNVPMTMREIIGMVGTFLAIAALVTLLIWWLRRRNQKDPEPIPVYIPPAHVTALEKLNILEKEKLWQQDKTKQYYTRLTYAFREYLGNRYGVNALESTTDEILGWLRREKFSDSLTTKLRNTLQASDLVKFAKSKPGVDIHQNALNTAYEFIHATKKTLTEEDEQQLNKVSSSPKTTSQASVLAYASIPKRAAASILDMTIYNIITIVMAIGSAKLFESTVLFTLGMLLGFIIAILYFTILEASSKQATLGKQVFGIIVVDKNGKRISFRRSLARNLFRIVSGLPLSLGYFWALFNKERKTWHDMAAGTLVISKTTKKGLMQDEQELIEM